MVAWTDYSQTSGDTSVRAVRGQIFDASGTVVGDEFLVNTTTEGSQYTPSVSALDGGGFVVTWTDGSSGYAAVRGQLFDANGTAVGDEFLVNTTTEGGHYAPSVSALEGGGFVATWYDINLAGSYAVHGQIFSANATAVGDEFLVNTTTEGGHYAPSVSTLEGGGFVVTWYDIDLAGSYAVHGQIFSANGTAVGDEFLVNTTTTNFQYQQPSVTGLADGGFVVTWTEGSSFATVIRGQTFDASGTKIGDELFANTTATKLLSEPSVSAFDGGGFVVTWTDGNQTGGDTSSYAVRGQLFDANGTAVGDEFLVNTTTEGNQSTPSVSALRGGTFVVTWEDGSQAGGDTSDNAVRGQIFDVIPALTIADPDDTNIESATVAITSGFAGLQDVLAFTDQNGITGTYDADNGILTLTGSASLADYETAFQKVTYENTSDDPSTAIRTLSITVNDGDAYSNVVTRDITVIPINDAPTGSPTTVLADGTEDVPYTVTATQLLEGFSDAEGDTLSVANLAASNGTVTDNGDGTYTITPTADFNGTMTLTYDVTDGNGGSLTSQTQSYTLTPVDDAPVLTGIGEGSLSYWENDPPSPLFTPGDPVVTIGDEFLVNTAIENSQDEPSVAGLAGGGFVVAWTDYSQTSGDTSVRAVRGQIFDASGTVVGDEFLVNTTTEGSQYTPSVSALDGGGFVVTWTDGSSGYAAVRGQSFDANGTAVGDEFLVNTTTEGGHYAPSVSALEGGGFVATWYDINLAGSYAVHGQIFSANATAVGDEFLVNTTTEGGHYAPSVSTLEGGGFVVTWYDIDLAGSYAVHGQIFSANGTAVGDEFLVNTTTTNFQYQQPSVTGLADGGF